MAWWDSVGQSLTSFGDWTQTPQGQAGLMQFGLNMLSDQPRGQSFLGSLAQSIGQGAEAAGRTDDIQAGEEERRRKAEKELQQMALEGRKVAAEERDVASKIQERKAAPGGISATAMFNAQNRDENWFRSEFAKARLDPFNQDKSDDEITASLMSAVNAGRKLGSPQKATGGQAASPGAQGGAAASPSGAPPAPYEGQVRTSRATGAKQRFTNGQWVPM